MGSAHSNKATGPLPLADSPFEDDVETRPASLIMSLTPSFNIDNLHAAKFPHEREGSLASTTSLRQQRISVASVETSAWEASVPSIASVDVDDAEEDEENPGELHEGNDQ